MIGGLDVYILNTISYTDDTFDFVIIHGKKDKNKPIMKNGQAIKEYPINLYRELNPLNDLKGLFQIIKIIKIEKPDIIHCHSAKGGVLGRIAGFFTDTKTFYTPHAFSFLSTNSKIKKNIYLTIERIVKLKSFLLACSESEKEIGIKEVGYKRDRSFVWNNAVPDSGLYIKSCKMNKGYICYIGRPSYQKNSFFFIDVINGVHKKFPSIQFKLLGVGYYSPDLEQIKDLISQYKLNEVVELLPWLSHDETLRYVKESLFYLTVSRYEGLPLSVIEAMSLGKAIIASNVVGNIDCVINGYNGFLVPLIKESFIDAICQMIENDSERNKFGINSRILFEKKFLITNRIKELENIYRSKTK